MEMILKMDKGESLKCGECDKLITEKQTAHLETYEYDITPSVYCAKCYKAEKRK